MAEQIIINSKESLDRAYKLIQDNFDKHGYTTYSCKHGISSKQFNAMHVWCGMVAERLDAHGVDMRALSDACKASRLPLTKDSVREYFYKPILAALTGKESTTVQKTVEPKQVEFHIRDIAMKNWEIELPDWPERK